MNNERMGQDLETNITQIIEQQKYDLIPSVILEYGDKALAVFYQKTEEGKLNIKSREGRYIWRQIIVQYKEDIDKINDIYYELGKETLDKYLEAVVWGVTSVLMGYKSSYEMVKRSTRKRRIKRGKKLLTQVI